MLGDGQLLAFCDEHVPQGDGAPQRAALQRLKRLFTEWLHGDAFLMYVSGSFRLGVYSEHADLDVVLVLPATTARGTVFAEGPSGFPAFLRRATGVTDVMGLPNARVPLITAVVDGQDMDIMTVHLRVARLPARADVLWCYEWMNGLDEASVRSFNGPRVTEVLIRDFCAVEGLAKYGLARDAFQTAVRLVRFWCKQRAVYSNKAGFLGGVNVALLMGWAVLQLREQDPVQSGTLSDPPAPVLSACALVRAFFMLLAHWQPAVPLVLHTHVRDVKCPDWLLVYDNPPPPGGPTSAGAATVPGGGVPAGGAPEPVHLSTPCFPRFNTMHAASRYTVNILWQELCRGAAIVADAVCDAALPCVLPTLCEPVLPGLLAHGTRFVEVRIRAPRTPPGLLWQGYVEAQARILVNYVKGEELGLRHMRAIPVWVTLPPPEDGAANEDMVTRAMYMTAEPDGKKRTHVLTGDLHRPLKYFLSAHTEAAGPPRPACASLHINFVTVAQVPSEALLSAAGSVAVRSSAEVAPCSPDHAAPQPAKSVSAADQWLQLVPVPRRKVRPRPPSPVRWFGLHSQQAAPVASCFGGSRGRLRVIEPPSGTWPRQADGGSTAPSAPSAPVAASQAAATRVRVRRLHNTLVDGMDVYVGPVYETRNWRLNPYEPHLLGPPPAGTPLADYAKWVEDSVRRGGPFRTALMSLAHKRVGCWCVSDSVCHAAVLVRAANRLTLEHAAPRCAGVPPPRPARPAVALLAEARKRREGLHGAKHHRRGRT